MGLSVGSHRVCSKKNLQMQWFPELVQISLGSHTKVAKTILPQIKPSYISKIKLGFLTKIMRHVINFFF